MARFASVPRRFALGTLACPCFICVYPWLKILTQLSIILTQGMLLPRRLLGDQHDNPVPMKLLRIILIPLWLFASFFSLAEDPAVPQAGGADQSTTKNAPLIAAARNGDMGQLVKSLTENTDPEHGVNLQDSDGWTALMHAASRDHRSIVNVLINNWHADVNAKDRNGWTALALAAHIGHSSVVGTLLEGGAQINLKSKKNTTALICAAGKGHTEIVKILLSSGADAAVKDANDKSALDYATEKGYADIVEMLKSEANRSSSSYFSFPPDTPPPAGTIPQGPLKDLVVRVGPGGVMRMEHEKAMRDYAHLKGLNAAPEGGFAIVEQQLTPQDRSNALYNAIDDELLFQAALAAGFLDQEENRKWIRQEFYNLLLGAADALAGKLEKEEGKQSLQFRMMNVSAESASQQVTEAQIGAYYKDHTNEFLAPVSVFIKYDSFPSETDEGGFGMKGFREARENPVSKTDWQGKGEWVMEGQKPSCMRDGEPYGGLDGLFKTPKGGVSPVIRGVVYTYIFWVTDKKESGGLKPLNEVKTKVIHRIAGMRFSALNKILNTDSDRFYRMAINEGIHRTHLKSQIGFKHWANKGIERGEVIKKLKQEFKIEVLLKDSVFAQDNREKSLEEDRKREMAEMGLRRFDREGAKSEMPPIAVKPSEWLSWLAWLVIIPVVLCVVIYKLRQ